MRILQLNVWTGRIKGSLENFFQENQFDVICLQEAVWCDNLLLENFCLTVDQIKSLCKMEYDFRSANWRLKFANSTIQQGNVILSKQPFSRTNEYVVHGECINLESFEDTKNQGYTLQIAQLPSGINIINHHGYWLPTPIGDKTTVETMQRVADIVKPLNGPTIMCGDLNIIHDSPAMRPLDFLRDLTHEYKIDNTLAGLKFDGKVACDHILVSDDIKVTKFEVLDKPISDHKALITEVDI